MDEARQLEQEVWLTTSQAAALEGVTSRAVRKKAMVGEVVSKKAKACLGGGINGKGYLVALSSLSTPARRKYFDKYSRELQQQSEDVKDEKKDAPARTTDNLAEIEAKVGKQRFNKLLRQAERKVEAAKEYIEISDERGRAEKALEIAERYGVSRSTLYRWVDTYKKGGLAAMIKVPNLGKGTVRRAVEPEAERFIKSHWLQLNKPKAAHVHKKLKKFCDKTGLPYPSRATVYRVVEDIKKHEPDLVCLAREGEEAYEKKFAAKITRQNPEYRNQVWEGDHHIMDVFINYQGRPVRPWLTAWQDVATRVLTGVTLSLQANGRTIAMALRHGILKKKLSGWDSGLSNPMAHALTSLGWDMDELSDRAGAQLPYYGIPQALYIDNGKDYISQIKKGRKSEDWEYSREVRSACEILSIKPVFATAYSPWAKGHVERWFGTMTDQFARYLPGYCGSDNKKRPHGLNEKKMCERGELLTLEELYLMLEFYIDIYHQTEHSSLGMSPAAKYEMTPPVRDGLPDERTMDICLMDSDKVKVSSSGIQRFGTKSRRRWYTHPVLDDYVGRKVVIRYDPNRIGELLVFDPSTGKYVCTATNKELLDWGASEDDLKEFIKKRSRRRKEVKARLAECQDFGLEVVTASRQQAGPVQITGDTTGDKETTMITGMEEAARRSGKRAKNSPQKKKETASGGRFDEWIRKLGSQA